MPLAALLLLGARIEWLWRGALAWVLALIAKLALMATLGMGASSVPAWLYGVFAGLISASTELGFAWLALTRAATFPSAVDILLFAVAAASLEALALLAWTLLVRTPNADVARWREAANVSLIVRHQFLWERSVAWFGHLASRSLLALAVVHQVPTLAVVAFLTFALTDGLAAFETQRGADWFSAAVLRRYFGVAAAIVLLELAVLVGYVTLS